MVIDISKITLENIDKYSSIREYKKGMRLNEFEKEIYKKEREKQHKEQRKTYHLKKKRGDIE